MGREAVLNRLVGNGDTIIRDDLMSVPSVLVLAWTEWLADPTAVTAIRNRSERASPVGGGIVRPGMLQAIRVRRWACRSII